MLKPSEKFKNIFNFDWDPIEDTSHDINPLYKNRLKSQFMFGRGLQGGFDVTQQKQQAINYKDIVHKYDLTYIDKHKKPKDKDREKEKEKQKEKYAQKGQQDSENEDNDNDQVKQVGINQRKELGDMDHWSMKTSKMMSERDWRIFREDNEIIIKGGRVPKPIRNWSEIDLPQYILDALKRLKYDTPTAIQMQAIPIGLMRKDFVGLAPTGSGKTAAYLIPLIIYLKTLPPMDYEVAREGPYSLIMLPSRELAEQIEVEFKQLTINLRLKSVVLVGGGINEGQQDFKLQRGCEVLIGTTGRIRAALERKDLVLNQCSWVILDEADRMIDKTFELDVNFILDNIKTQLKSTNEDEAELQEQVSKNGQEIYRVTHLFSATMPREIENLAKKYMRSFCYVSIGEPGGGKKDIEQRIELISEHDKK